VTEVIELKQVLSALIGAILALAGQSLLRKASKARIAKRLAIALWEELSATQFYGPEEMPNFVGFSSQTFDGLFREVAEAVPESLSRDLMRYHWRMKYMESMKPVTIPRSRGVQSQFWAEARDLHVRLMTRLKQYGQRRWLSLFFQPSETSAGPGNPEGEGSTS
jgi:hypothetical protein